jgi:hypothetical protein
LVVLVFLFVLLVLNRSPVVDYNAIYRNLVFISAADSEDGVKAPPQILVWIDDEYKPLKDSAPSYEAHSLYHCWVYDSNRTVYVTAQGYSTQALRITKAINIVALLDRMNRGNE